MCLAALTRLPICCSANEKRKLGKAQARGAEIKAMQGDQDQARDHKGIS